MTRLLVNALSVANQSGYQVLFGHLKQIVAALSGRLQLVLIGRADLSARAPEFAKEVVWMIAPAATRHWLFRASWEDLYLPRIARCVAAQAYFTPSGMAAGSLEIPQIVFCQNPWALEPAARRRRDALKAALQRRAYRRAMRIAEAMVFNSAYMQQAYRRNAGFPEKRGLVVYQAPDDDIHRRAVASATVPRKPRQILCVSAMGPHKNVETLLGAVGRLRQEGLSDVRLLLVGAWPDAAYERKIRALIVREALTAAVSIQGHLPREELDQFYAESHAFCLPSRCESFSIPTVEAQLFGTPVIGSTTGAMPEIGADGGIYCDPDDSIGFATALRRLLTQPEEWQRYSARARQNAQRFTWNQVSRPLVELVAEMITRPASPPPRSLFCCKT